MVEEGVGLDGWDDDVDVTNLVHDISHNCVDRWFWDVNEEPPTTTKKKRPTSVSETDVESQKKKKANDTKTVGVEADCLILCTYFLSEIESYFVVTSM